MCALIAQRFIGTILHWRLTKRARRNVNFTAFSDDELFDAAVHAVLCSRQLNRLDQRRIIRVSL